MKHYTIFYRVPSGVTDAGHPFHSFLSSTSIEASSRNDATDRFYRLYPTYHITSILEGSS